MKIANYEIEVNQDGTLNYSGYLDLSGTGITSMPDNLTVGGYQDGEWCTENGKVTNEPHYWMPIKLPNAIAEASAMKCGE